MQTWTAKDIVKSYGAYSGQQVKFTIRQKLVIGTLTRSDRCGENAAMLIVDGVRFVLANSTPVEVL